MKRSEFETVYFELLRNNNRDPKIMISNVAPGIFLILPVGTPLEGRSLEGRSLEGR